MLVYHVWGEHAADLRLTRSRALQDKLERVDSPIWRRLLFNLCFLHSVALERRKFDSLGWSQVYNFNVGDLSACISYLERHMTSLEGHVSWTAVQYVVAEVQYGGMITDSADRRLFHALAERWIAASAMDNAVSLFPTAPVVKGAREFEYLVRLAARPGHAAPLVCHHHVVASVLVLVLVLALQSTAATEFDAVVHHVQAFPDLDTPEIFGLHPNADLTYRIHQCANMFSALMETQPRQLEPGDARSMEDVVAGIAADILKRLPAPYLEVRSFVV